jgi:hypothetical protein
VSLHIGFGNQGFSSIDIANFPVCASNWCDLFAQYAGKVPLELQTFGLSNSSGKPPIGSLVKLLPFAVEHHATVLELYCGDWLLAF